MSFIKKEKIYYFITILISLTFFYNLETNSEKHGIKWGDQFFDADVYRVSENLKNSNSHPQSENNLHPFFPLVGVSIAKIPSYLGFENLEFSFYKIFFGTISFFMFWFFLYKETSTSVSYASLLLLMSTMTVRVWSTIPETFLFGFFTIMITLLLIRGKSNPVYATVASFGGTVTNVMFGFFYLIFKEKKNNKIIEILIKALFIVVAISLIQKNIYTSAIHFFDPARMFRDVGHFNFDILQMPYRIFDFFISGFVLPINAHNTFPLDTYQIWKYFMTEESNWRVLLATYLSIILILILIAKSLYNYFKSKKEFTLKIILYFILFQLFLHNIFGVTPFLFSYHFIPLIIIFIAKINFVTKVKYLPYVIVVLSALIQEVNISHYGETFNFLLIK